MYSNYEREKREYLELTKLIEEFSKDNDYEKAKAMAQRKLDYIKWQNSLPSKEKEQFNLMFNDN
jgi:hypothetical protein